MKRRFSAAATVCILFVTACSDGDARDGTIAYDEWRNPSPSSAPCEELTQWRLRDIASKLRLVYAVVENVPSDCPATAPAGLCLKATISLTNTGAAWNAKNFAIHFSGIRKVLTVEGSEFKIAHLNGDQHKLTPGTTFTGFKAGETKTIRISAEYWMMSESDFMPRAYMVAKALKPEVITNTDTEVFARFVAPFVDPKQTRRHPDDKSIIATAATRYEENTDVPDLGFARVASEVVPRPLTTTVGTGTLDIHNGLTLQVMGLNNASIEQVYSRLAQLGVSPTTGSGVRVRVTVNPSAPQFSGQPKNEAYSLEIATTGITIVGADRAGAYYGLQSLINLLPPDGQSKTLPILKIPYDAPRYPYRGVQIDVARNFHGLSTITKVLDQMAAYKLNRLHLHLSDDEGFRLEIPGLPELTQTGARRCHDPNEQRCLMPQLGSGPTPDTSGSGYFSRDQFITLLRAAKARHIRVIPEFDMPGHARAAIKSMQERARRGDPSYLLSDPEDTSQYLSIQNYKDNAINACMESTYRFVAKLMDGVQGMYAAAGAEFDTWHVGADEVAPGAWTQSNACDALFVSGGEVKGPEDVHGYFVRRVNELAKSRGLGIRGWSDGMRKTVVDASGKASKVFLDPQTDLDGNRASANFWGTLFWWDNSAYRLANAGYQVLLTSPDFLYLDHPYEADPSERGYYWATRYTNVRKLFSYISGNLPANSQLTKDRMGNDYTAVFIPTAAVPTPVEALNKPENIIGLEGPLWTETVRTPQQLEYMMFPRLLALAERAWHRASWEPHDGTNFDADIDTTNLVEDWQRFANVLGHKELPKLDQAQVRYRIEVPGGKLEASVLRANVAFPGLTIEYQTATGDFQAFDPANPPHVTTTQIRARTKSGRIGRAIRVE